jgi:hypothetical protein
VDIGSLREKIDFHEEDNGAVRKKRGTKREGFTRLTAIHGGAEAIYE